MVRHAIDFTDGTDCIVIRGKRRQRKKAKATQPETATEEQADPMLEPEPEPEPELEDDGENSDGSYIWSDDEDEVRFRGEYTSKAGDTWSDVCEILGIEGLEEQERYFQQLKTQCRMGNVLKFKKEKGAYFFPNPVRRQRYPARYGQTGGKQWEFPKGLTFPKLKPLAVNNDSGSEEQNNLLVEQESRDIECEVYLDWKQHNQETLGIEEWEEQKLLLQKAADSAGMEVHWATAEEEHYNDPRTGLPIAPKSVRALIKRGKQAEQEKWWAAISKEIDGLKAQGVFQMMTYRELVAKGYVTDKIKPIPLRMLLNTKIKPSGEFDKAKARYVLQGDPQHMQKGVHFSVVFAPTPGLETGRILQAYAVGNNKSRFAFDINQAFLHAPCMLAPEARARPRRRPTAPQ